MTNPALQDDQMMAKKKAKKLGRPKKLEGAKSERYGFRARPVWIDWLTRFANHKRSDLVDVIDAALERHAEAEGFETPPKR